MAKLSSYNPPATWFAPLNSHTSDESAESSSYHGANSPEQGSDQHRGAAVKTNSGISYVFTHKRSRRKVRPPTHVPYNQIGHLTSTVLLTLTPAVEYFACYYVFSILKI